MKISDNQGFGSVQNLLVTVCDCTVTPNCHARRSSVQPSVSAAGIIIFALLFLLGKAESLDDFMCCAYLIFISLNVQTNCHIKAPSIGGCGGSNI